MTTNDVNDLQGKIKCLVAALGLSESALLGGDRETVRAGYGRNKLNAHIELSLAKKAGFDPNSPQWRRGTRGDFEIHLKNLREGAARLKATRIAQPEAVYEPIASLELFASQPGPGQPWPLSADLVCQPARLEGILVAVKRGWVAFDCGDAETDRLASRKGYPDGLKAGNATAIPSSANTHHPEWEIFTETGPLGLVSLPADFCPVSGLVPGAIITATFSVYIKDLDDGEQSAAGEHRSEDGNISSAGADSFVRQDGEPLDSPAKRKILKRLAMKQLQKLGHDGSQDEKEGRQMICRHCLRFDSEKAQQGHE